MQKITVQFEDGTCHFITVDEVRLYSNDNEGVVTIHGIDEDTNKPIEKIICSTKETDEVYVHDTSEEYLKQFGGYKVLPYVYSPISIVNPLENQIDVQHSNKTFFVLYNVFGDCRDIGDSVFSLCDRSNKSLLFKKESLSLYEQNALANILKNRYQAIIDEKGYPFQCGAYIPSGVPIEESYFDENLDYKVKSEINSRNTYEDITAYFIPCFDPSKIAALKTSDRIVARKSSVVEDSPYTTLCKNLCGDLPMTIGSYSFDVPLFKPDYEKLKRGWSRIAGKSNMSINSIDINDEDRYLMDGGLSQEAIYFLKCSGLIEYVYSALESKRYETARALSKDLKIPPLKTLVKIVGKSENIDV